MYKTSITRNDVDGDNVKYIPFTHNRFAAAKWGQIYSFSDKMNGRCIGSTGAGGYYTASIVYRDGKRKNVYVHRLIAELFIPNPNNEKYVMHIDDCKEHNNVDNLMWVTQKANCNWSDHNLKLSKSIKEYYAKRDTFGNMPVRVAVLDTNGALLSIEPSINAAGEFVHHETGKNTNASTVQISYILQGRVGFRTCGGFKFRKANEDEYRTWVANNIKEMIEKENVNPSDVQLKKINNIEGLEMVNRKFIPETGKLIEVVKDVPVGEKIVNNLQ